MWQLFEAGLPVHRRADAHRVAATDVRIRDHDPLLHTHVHFGVHLRGAVDLAPGRDAASRIEKHHRSEVPELAFVTALNDENALTEGTVVGRPTHGEADGDAETIIARFKTGGQYAVDGGRGGAK